GRDAFEKSVSPWMNFSKPPPVPETPTVTWTFGCVPAYSSTIPSIIGATVDDPSPETCPSNCAASELPCWAVSPPQAPRSTDEPRIVDAITNFQFFIE